MAAHWFKVWNIKYYQTSLLIHMILYFFYDQLLLDLPAGFMCLKTWIIFRFVSWFDWILKLKCYQTLRLVCLCLTTLNIIRIGYWFVWFLEYHIFSNWAAGLFVFKQEILFSLADGLFELLKFKYYQTWLLVHLSFEIWSNLAASSLELKNSIFIRRGCWFV